MVIQHNLTALNCNRQFNITNESLYKSTRNLSSGYRINVAADDAAGLSISEKMRKQIRGLTQASLNAEDGISLVQVADGAMNEIHDMLGRCYELSVKAANGTLSNSDRQTVQDELDQIMTEIDSIKERTKFNEVYVLKGELYTKVEVPPSSDVYIDDTPFPSWVRFDTAFTTKSLSEKYATTESYEYGTEDNPQTGTVQVWHPSASIDFSNLTAGNVNELIGKGIYSTCCTCRDHYTIQFVSGTTNSREQSGSHQIFKIGIDGVSTGGELIDRIISGTNNGNPGNHFTMLEKDPANSNKLQIMDMRRLIPDSENLPTDFLKWNNTDVHKASYLRSGVFPNGSFGTGIAKSTFDAGVTSSMFSRQQLAIHAGDEADMTNKVIMYLPSITELVDNLKTIDVLSEEKATNTIRRFDRAIAFVNTERSRMGAYQNRLEHTVKNLDNVVENTQESESQIRDTDMAKEMVKYANFSVLMQAGQSMLAQAKQSNQGVLSLIT